ncbi:DnaJ domain-containing protein [Niveibacterium sp. SC-1]|uniref:J domain-containing protein n=1 Tax=Niveibacterium sp. SC-1 TaxID=3135646 RepID=UPI003120338E
MHGQSLYDILGVAEDASDAAIREAFLVESSRHADRDGGPDPAREACLIAVREAYAILGNPQERAGYDSALNARRFHPGQIARAANGNGSRICMALGMAVAMLLVWNGWGAVQVREQMRHQALELQEHAEAQQRRVAEAERRAELGYVSMNNSPLVNDWARNDVANRNERSFENVRSQVDRITAENANRADAQDREARWAAVWREEARRRERRQAEYEAAEAAREQLERDKAYLHELEMDNRRFSLR